MALPGVRTLLKDRFYSVSRTDIPRTTRVAIIARRGATPTPGAVVDADANITAPQNYDPYYARTENEVVRDFGEDSELHRAYVEAVAGGAATVILVALPADTVDADLTVTTTGNPFDTAFDAVETVQPDIVVPWGRGWHPTDANASEVGFTEIPVGFAADNDVASTASLAKRVADKVREISDRSHPCFAVMGIEPFGVGDIIDTGESMTPTEVATHLTLPNLISKDDASMTNGGFIVVTAVENRPSGYPTEWGYSNGAAHLAGFISSLNAENAPTAKRLYNISGLRYVPTRVQADTVAGKGVVPVNLDFTRAATVVDGTTFAKTGSDYGRLSTLRIVFDAVRLVRNACQEYVGRAATLELRNAMETAITNRLRSMQIEGALINSDFIVSYIPNENRAIIEMTLVPAFELRNIDVAIAIQL